MRSTFTNWGGHQAARGELPYRSRVANTAAKAVVLRLVDELGFDGVDAGGLDESWRQQPDTPVYATDLDANGVRRALAKASKERNRNGALLRSPGT